MDWQHLLMNGEHLPEYAALLAAEGLLGHQHANSGWGTFDDDNMVGATAFMETLELALELRRAATARTASGSASTSIRTPRTRSGAVKRSVLQWRFIDSVAAQIDDAALREAQQAQGCRACLRDRLRGARRAEPRASDPTRWSASTSARPRSRASRSIRDGGVLATAEAGYPLSTPRPGWAEQDPEDWWRRPSSVLDELRRRRRPARGHRSLAARCTAWSRSTPTTASLRPAILWNDQRTAAECAEIERTVGLERLIALTGNRALPGFTAPKLLWLRRHEPETYGRIARIALPKDYVRLRLCGEHATDVSDASGTLLLDVAGALVEPRGARRARARRRAGSRGAREPSRLGPHGGRSPGGRRRRRPGGGRAGRRRRSPGPGVRRARHIRRRVRGARAVRGRSRRRACTRSATPYRAPGTRWA